MDTSSTILPPDVDRGRPLQAVVWAPFPIALGLVLSRFYVRIRRRQVGWDDWLMLAALMFYLAQDVYGSYIIAIGSTRHVEYLAQDPELLATVLRGNTTVMILGIISHTFSKTSIALLLPRILQGTKSKINIVLWVHVVINAIFSILLIAFFLARCEPFVAAFYPQMVLEGQAVCNGQGRVSVFGVFQSAWGGYMDFFLAIIPILFIYKLQIKFEQKLAICGLLGLGSIAGALSIIKTYELFVWFHSSDLTWDSKGVYIWAFLEIPWIIIAGSIPPSKPLWDYVFHNRPVKDPRPGVPSTRSSRRWLLFGTRRSATVSAGGNFDSHPQRINSHETKPKLHVFVRKSIDVELSSQAVSREQDFGVHNRWEEGPASSVV